MAEHKIGDRAKIKMVNGGGSWWVNATLASIGRTGQGRFDIDKKSASGGGFSYRALDSDAVKWLDE